MNVIITIDICHGATGVIIICAPLAPSNEPPPNPIPPVPFIKRSQRIQDNLKKTKMKKAMSLHRHLFFGSCLFQNLLIISLLWVLMVL
jgi:hypothetical protein